MINYSGRASELGDTVNLVDRTDDCPVYHALSVHLCRAKSTTRFDDRYTLHPSGVAKSSQMKSNMTLIMVDKPQPSYNLLNVIK